MKSWVQERDDAIRYIKALEKPKRVRHPGEFRMVTHGPYGNDRGVITVFLNVDQRVVLAVPDLAPYCFDNRMVVEASEARRIAKALLKAADYVDYVSKKKKASK